MQVKDAFGQGLFLFYKAFLMRAGKAFFYAVFYAKVYISVDSFQHLLIILYKLHKQIKPISCGFAA